MSVSQPISFPIPLNVRGFNLNAASMAQFVQYIDIEIYVNYELKNTVRFASTGNTHSKSTPMMCQADVGPYGLNYFWQSSESPTELKITMSYSVDSNSEKKPVAEIFALPDTKYGAINPQTNEPTGLTLCGFTTSDDGNPDSYNMNSQLFITMIMD